MRVLIVGVAGTFMAGVAKLAKECQHEVLGFDQGIYPPMSTQLAKLGIVAETDVNTLLAKLDQVDMAIIGNHFSRGHPLVEAILAKRIPTMSGPAWLYHYVLAEKERMVVSGTHGKTTTTSLISWIMLPQKPGFLIGGVCQGFDYSANLGNEWFVLEGDEYDSCYDDKRPKFMHYKPDICLINNIEFDHADIYPNLDSIIKQFHYLVRTISPKGTLVVPHGDPNVEKVLSLGLWSNKVTFGEQGDWAYQNLNASQNAFDVMCQGKTIGHVDWQMRGKHNALNALAAIACVVQAGIKPEVAIAQLNQFPGVKRRLEIKANVRDIRIYDDFAHHPTAIAYTLDAMRANMVKPSRLIAVLELGSYTMRTGVHGQQTLDALQKADQAYLYAPNDSTQSWPFEKFKHVDGLVDKLVHEVKSGDQVVFMSSRGFDGAHDRLVQRLQ